MVWMSRAGLETEGGREVVRHLAGYWREAAAAHSHLAATSQAGSAWIDPAVYEFDQVAQERDRQIGSIQSNVAFGLDRASQQNRLIPASAFKARCARTRALNVKPLSFAS